MGGAGVDVIYMRDVSQGRPADEDSQALGPWSNLAVASLALSILWLGGLGSLIAVVFGIAALAQIRKANDGRRGAGLARAGLVLGVIGVVVTAAIVGLAVAISNVKVGPITLPPPSFYGIDMALSPDGSVAYLTEPSSNRLLVLNARSGTIIATVAVGNTPSGLAVSPDGSQVWVVNTQLNDGLSAAAGTITVVATATDLVVGTITTLDPGSIDVAFSPDGHSAYVTNNGILASGSVSVIDTATLSVVGTLTLAPPSSLTTGWNPTSVAVSPDGQQVWVSEVNALDGSSTTPDFVYVFDATTDTQVAKITVGAGPYFMALSRDGRYAYVADKLSCDVREIDTATFQVVSTVRWPSSHGCPFGIAAGPEDDVAYTVTGSDHTIDEGKAGNSFGSVDFATSEAVVHDNIGSDPVTVTLSPDGTTAYVVDADLPVVDLVNPTTGSVASRFTLPEAPTTTAAALR
jgi:YVTN family beta-propeller protein